MYRSKTAWFFSEKEELYEECPLSSLNEPALEIHSLAVECEPPLFQHQQTEAMNNQKPVKITLNS
jgi:hypothetical protein